MTELEFATSQDAWEGINEYLFVHGDQIAKERRGHLLGTQVLAFDVKLKIRKARVDPDFNFGRILGYAPQKWTSLVNNYVNFEYLDILKGQILAREKKGGAHYNEALLFDNSHTSGKGCLLSLVFSRRPGYHSPILTFKLRSSEVTKRLIFDLLLIQRIGEYVYGPEADFSLQVLSPNMYLDIAAFCLYNSYKGGHKKLKIWGKGLVDEESKTFKNMKKHWDKFHEMKLEEIRYRSHERVVSVIQKNEDGSYKHFKKDLYAKQLQFDFVEGDMPEELKSPKEIRKYKKDKRKKLLNL